MSAEKGDKVNKNPQRYCSPISGDVVFCENQVTMGNMDLLKDRRVDWQHIAVIVILAAVSGGIILGCQRWGPSKGETATPEEKPREEVNKGETANWVTFRNENQRYELKYPGNIITISEAGDRVILTHSIPFEHPDPCDFRGDAPPRKTLTDFKVTIELVGRNLGETFIARESGYMVSNFLLDNELKIEPGFIDEISVGSLKEYRITQGVEGCGEYSYYLYITPKNTLVVRRSFIAEFNPIIASYEEYLKLPGIISPDEEERLFNQILSTFRILD